MLITPQNAVRSGERRRRTITIGPGFLRRHVGEDRFAGVESRVTQILRGALGNELDACTAQIFLDPATSAWAGPIIGAAADAAGARDRCHVSRASFCAIDTASEASNAR